MRSTDSGINQGFRWQPRPFTFAKHSKTCNRHAYRPRFLAKSSLGRSGNSKKAASPSEPTWQKIGAWIATAGFAAALSLTCVTQSVLAVTNEQLLFLEAWRAVDRAYYDKNFNGKSWFRIREQYIKDKQLTTRPETYAAIKALLAELDDPFTRFLEPSRYAALKRGTAGSLTGVGLEVGFDSAGGSDSDLVVITPSADGPADKAGIKPRDHVVAIDGKPTKGTSLYDAGELLQGPEGSQVTLTIRSDGSDPREVQLMRQRIINNPVSSQLCQKVPLGEVTDPPESFGKVGYIRVATFSKQTTENVKTALHKLQAEKANMVVLDIRNNGGGLFPAGVEVARSFLNEGDIVLIADSQGVRDSYPASNIAVEPSKPLSVLVNRGTASASEVLAGALQDNGRAKIVGEKTFGKGLIQTIVELSDGSGVAVTVARYQTPLGTDINKKGIQPDILIDTGDMPPTNGPAFCKYVASKGAAVLFDAKAAAKMPKDGLEKRAEGSGDSMPIDVTQYENAFISGQPSPSVKAPEPSTPAPQPSPEASSSPSEAPASSPNPEPAQEQKPAVPEPIEEPIKESPASLPEEKPASKASSSPPASDSSKPQDTSASPEEQSAEKTGPAPELLSPENQAPEQGSSSDSAAENSAPAQTSASEVAPENSALVQGSATDTEGSAPVEPSSSTSTDGEQNKSTDSTDESPSLGSEAKDGSSVPADKEATPEDSQPPVEPPIQDSPVTVEEIKTPAEKDITPSPAVEEQPQGNPAALSPVDFNGSIVPQIEDDEGTVPEDEVPVLQTVPLSPSDGILLPESEPPTLEEEEGPVFSDVLQSA